MAWADADLKIFAAGLAIGGKWNHVNGKDNNQSETFSAPIITIVKDAYTIQPISIQSIDLNQVIFMNPLRNVIESLSFTNHISIVSLQQI